MKPSSGFGSWGEAKPEVAHMIGAGFRLGSQSPESKLANHSARVGRLAGGRLAPVRRNWGPNRAWARTNLPEKNMSSKSLSAPGFRSAFRCSQRLGASKRSPVLVARAPPTPFVSASPPWRKCCVNVWVFQTPETHKHKQDRRASPDKNRSESVATPAASTRTNVWVFQTPETRKRKRC